MFILQVFYSILDSSLVTVWTARMRGITPSMNNASTEWLCKRFVCRGFHCNAKTLALSANSVKPDMTVSVVYDCTSVTNLWLAASHCVFDRETTGAYKGATDQAVWVRFNSLWPAVPVAALRFMNMHSALFAIWMSTSNVHMIRVTVVYWEWVPRTSSSLGEILGEVEGLKIVRR